MFKLKALLVVSLCFVAARSYAMTDTRTPEEKNLHTAGRLLREDLRNATQAEAAEVARQTVNNPHNPISRVSCAAAKKANRPVPVAAPAPAAGGLPVRRTLNFN